MAVKGAKADKEQESYYSKVKAENEALKEKVAWLDGDSFLLDSQADVRQVYVYMRKNPASARFIYQKYKPLQPTIKELCDPNNPLYLPEVRKVLDGVIEFENDKENVEQLKAEISKEQREIELLQDELDELKAEYDTKQESVEAIKREYEEAMKQRSNIRTDAGLEMIEKTNSDVMSFIDSILQKWNTYFKEHGGATLGMQLDKSELNHMDLLNRNLKQMMQRIHTEDFLSPESLDKYHQEMMEKIKQEKENALHEMDAFMVHNPAKVLAKITDNIGLSIRHFQKADVDMAGLKFFNPIGQNQVLNPLNDALGLLDHLQVQNKERRHNNE